MNFRLKQGEKQELVWKENTEWKFLKILIECSYWILIGERNYIYHYKNLKVLGCCRYKEKRWDFKQLLGSGGMPSSHSATVTALAIGVGLQDGFGGSTFATALTLACVVCCFLHLFKHSPFLSVPCEEMFIFLLTIYFCGDILFVLPPVVFSSFFPPVFWPFKL